MTEEAELVNQLIRELDAIGDHDRMLVRLGEAVEQIRRTCASTSAG